jgi:hypothetical protein
MTGPGRAGVRGVTVAYARSTVGHIWNLAHGADVLETIQFSDVLWGGRGANPGTVPKPETLQTIIVRNPHL